MKNDKFYCDVRVFKALAEISEILHNLAFPGRNQDLNGKKIDKLLKIINSLIK